MSLNQVVAVVIGTRPEAIKLAPLVEEIARQPEWEPLVVSTGQHRQMLDQALAAFDLRPDVDLDVMCAGQTLHDVTARTLSGLRRLFAERRPDWVVVQGDTTTAFAGALAAYYDQIPIGHVEAGLRSGNKYAPFPEELNRRLIDQLADLLFAPTAPAAEILLGEGFAPASVHVTGNTVVDALVSVRERVRRRPAEIAGLGAGQLEGRRLVLVTAHRRESFGAGLEAICRALLRIARERPDVLFVYPVHLNPKVDEPVRRMLGGEPGFVLLPPLGYLEFVTLMDRVEFVLSDSGGVQEEAPTFGKPLLVLREVTERPEGVAAGVARLVGTSEERIFHEAMRLLTDVHHYRSMASGSNPYGDGRAAQRIASLLTGHRAQDEEAATPPPRHARAEHGAAMGAAGAAAAGGGAGGIPVGAWS